MAIEAGLHRLGPQNARLEVQTGRKGAAAKAGHDLVLHVTSWNAALELGEDRAPATMELSADSASLRVHEGTGGMQPLGDDDKANIHQTIDDEVLRRQDIRFRSTRVESAGEGGPISVEGDLTMVGATRPITFELTIGDDGSLDASALVTQSVWGMKPYSALFGALKVADDVRVVLAGRL